MDKPHKPMVVGLGEALFDAFDTEELLGGAPLNVAVHAQQLGNRGVVASRIGDDARGRRVLNELRRRNVRADYLQIDPTRQTGVVHVRLDDGEPTYEIVEGVAWDDIHFDRRFANLAGQCDAVCFGTLAQRLAASRLAIQRFVEQAVDAIRLFDVNLRQQYYGPQLIEQSLKLATAAKLNLDELDVLAELFSLDGADADTRVRHVRERFQLEFVALTRGPRGVVVFTAEDRIDATPISVDTDGGDSVGAGDAAAAGLLHGVIRGWPWDRTLELANTVGAFVASRAGACPELEGHVTDLLDDSAA